MDGEGPLTSFAGAALVDIVGEEEVEALDQFGQVKAAPLVELRKRKDYSLWNLGRSDRGLKESPTHSLNDQSVNYGFSDLIAA